MNAGVEGAESGVSTTRQVADRRLGPWLRVMMVVAFGALALAVLAIPVVGFGSLLFVLLGVCAVMLLVMVGYGHQTRATLDAMGSGSGESSRKTGVR